jgi:hypothetical protein
MVARMSRSLRQQMQSDLNAAIKSGDALLVSVLRTTLAAVANAEAVDPAGATVRAGLLADVQRTQLGEDDVRQILDRELQEHRGAARDLRQAGQLARAAELDRRAAILTSYQSG